MANWKYKIDMSAAHFSYIDERLTIGDVAIELAQKLKASPYAKDEVIARCIESLECLNLKCGGSLDYDDEEESDEYDSILATVYDFGDVDHKLWINTTHSSDLK